MWEEVSSRQSFLRRLTDQEPWRRHQEQDHIPFRRGCPVCVASQGRQRSHWRASVTGVYALSVDIAGPFKPGRSWDPTASGRDRGLGYKYFLASAFSIPLAPTSEDKAGGPGTEAKPGVEPGDAPDEMYLPDMAELFGDDDEPELVSAGVEGPSLKVVERRFRHKLPEPEGPGRAHTTGEPTEPPPLPPPSKAPAGPVVRTRTLFLAVPSPWRHAVLSQSAAGFRVPCSSVSRR